MLIGKVNYSSPKPASVLFWIFWIELLIFWTTSSCELHNTFEEYLYHLIDLPEAS